MPIVAHFADSTCNRHQILKPSRSGLPIQSIYRVRDLIDFHYDKIFRKACRLKPRAVQRVVRDQVERERTQYGGKKEVFTSIGTAQTRCVRGLVVHLGYCRAYRDASDRRSLNLASSTCAAPNESATGG
jgi:hypothetical protein